MTNQAQRFREIVSGRRCGPAAVAARGLLRAIEVPYRCGVGLRNYRYDRGHLPAVRVGVPVVSVGNLTLGGTGKTPMVKWIARHLRRQGVAVAIVSRGYGASAGGRNDEALELAQALPDVPHVQNGDRVAAAVTAIEQHQVQLIVADDAFQHRRLARDFDVVLVDAVEPFGFGHVFPRGTLREPVESLQRADLVCVTRCDMVNGERRAEIIEQISSITDRLLICEVAHAPRGLVTAEGTSLELTELRDRRVAAFCGIGNPAGFRHTLDGAGCEVVAWREFPDHHASTATDVADLQTWAETSGADHVVCTHKDLVKVPLERLGGLALAAVTVEIGWLAGQAEMEAALTALFANG